MITKNKCIVICWFLVGLIVSRIFLGRFEFIAGIGYIFYPLWVLPVWGMSTDSGNQEFIDGATLFLGVLGVVYILIPLVVSVAFDRMKKRR